MHLLKAAGFIALNIALLTGASVAADAPSAVATKISATVMDGSDANRKSLDFSCSVESQGAVIGTFSSMQSSLVVSQPLPDIQLACDRFGYEQVRFAMVMPAGQVVTGDVAPRFTAARAP